MEAMLLVSIELQLCQQLWKQMWRIFKQLILSGLV